MALKLGDSEKWYRPQIGIVKDTTDALRMGRIRVYIPAFGSEEDDEDQWINVRYASPFAGATPTKYLKGQNPQDWRESQKSYGMWFPVPDVNNEVIVLFLNGDPFNGVYIGGMFHHFMNSSIPDIAGTTKIVGEVADSSYKPTSEYNKKILGETSSNDYKNPHRPVYNPLFDGLNIQGLESDFVRGITTSSARRTTKSRTYGIQTPRGTHIVMDDGYYEEELGQNDQDEFDKLDRLNGNPALAGQTQFRKDEFIRFRTRSGAQILIHETHGFIYLISRDGRNWVEMANDGHIDVYAEDDVSIHSESSINLYANKDINLEAGRNINVKTNGSTEPDSKYGTGNIYIESGPNSDQSKWYNSQPIPPYGETHITSHGSAYVSTEINLNTVVGNNASTEIYHDYNLVIHNDEFLKVDRDKHATVSNNYIIKVVDEYHVRSDNLIRTHAGQTHHAKSDNLLEHDSPTTNGWSNGGTGGPAGPIPPASIATNASPSTSATLPKVYDLVFGDESDVSTENVTITQAVTDRVPEHEPWLGHREMEESVPRIQADPTPAQETVSEGRIQQPNPAPATIGKASSGAPVNSADLVAGKKAAAATKVKTTAEAKTISIEEQRKRIRDYEGPPPGEKRKAKEMQISEKGTLNIINHESYRAVEYYDYKGYSIGYGHLRTGKESPIWQEKMNKGLTEEEAYELFLLDVVGYEASIRKRYGEVEMTQPQFDALVSLAYNLGSASAFGTQLDESIRSGDYDKAAETMLLYRNAGGSVNAGLVARREQEAKMFRQGEYPAAKSREQMREMEIRRLERNVGKDSIESHKNVKATDRQQAQASNVLAQYKG